jgi:uncharacterized protein CbrC (UPF0167 family)
MIRPELGETERHQIFVQRDDELSSMTPGIVTWNEFFWPAHCGDYCRYIKEVGKPELIALASDGDGLSFLISRDYEHVIVDAAHARQIWERVRPDAPSDNTTSYPVGVYLFRCLTCDEPLLIWDAE